MRLVKIKEIGQIISGSTPDTDVDTYWHGHIPWVTPKEISKLETPYLNDTERKITDAGLKACSTTLLPKGSLLFTSRAPIGLVAIANIDVTTNQGFKSLQLFSGFYPLYIYYALKYFSKRIEYLGTGTTFKELSKSTFENFEIPIPELIEDQIKISTTLYKIEELIKRRKESIQVLNDILMSTFQMKFGKVKGKKIPLSKLCKINPTKSEISKIDKETPVSFIPMTSVTEQGEMNVFNVKKLLEVWNGFTYFKNGDVVFAKISPSMENGKGAIARNLTNNIGFGTTEFHILRPLENISNSEWLYYLTMQKIFRKSAEQNMTGTGGQQRVSTDFFDSYKTVLPSITLQNDFAKIVGRSNELKLQYKNSLEKLQNLYASVSQQAFSGKLNIDKILLNNDEFELFKIQTAERNVIQTNRKSDKKPLKVSKKRSKSPKHAKVKILWDDISAETVANWIKVKYTGYHFNSEMLKRFLLEEHVAVLNYFSSEDLKKIPSLSSKDDLKKFLYNAINGDMPFIKIRQHFYNAALNNFSINITADDKPYLEALTIDERSGIYFTIEGS